MPKNAFVNAGVSPNTSILYLQKKENENENEREDTIFIAQVKNIGHTDSGKSSKESDQLPLIETYFNSYIEGDYSLPEDNTFSILSEEPLCFIIDPNLIEEEDIFDIYYYPEYFATMQTLKNKKCESIKEYLEKDNGIKGGYAFSSNYFLDSGEIMLIRIRNIGVNKINEEQLKYIPSSIYEKHLDVELEGGDIIVAMDGDEFRALVIPPKIKAVANQRVAILKVTNEIVPEVIAEYINSHLGTTQLERKKTKTTAGHITLDDIKNILIPELTKELQEGVIGLYGELNDAVNAKYKAEEDLKEAKMAITSVFLN